MDPGSNSAETFAIGVYDGPALALIDELALLKIEGGVVIAAKFCAIETGLSFVWRSYQDGRFTVWRPRPVRRPPVKRETRLKPSTTFDRSPGGELGTIEGPPER